MQRPLTDGRREHPQILHVPRGATGKHVRVLHRDGSDVRLVITFGVDDLEHVGERECARRIVQGGELDRGVSRRGTHLKADEVLATTGDDEHYVYAIAI